MEYARAFAIVCNDRYFPGLEAALGSIFAYYDREIRVFVMAHGIHVEHQRQLQQHPLGAALTIVDTASFARSPVGCWEAKQQTPAELVKQVKTLCLMDADLILLSRIEDVFEAAEQGKIVSSLDVGDVEYGPEFAVYAPRIVGKRHPYINSGFLTLQLRTHWDVIAMWDFASRFCRYSPNAGVPFGFPGYGDQGILNAILCHQNRQSALHVLPQKTWCNSMGWQSGERISIVERNGNQLTVMAEPLGERQRVLHSSGPKWWTPDGRRDFESKGDILASFEFMATLSQQV